MICRFAKDCEEISYGIMMSYDFTYTLYTCSQVMFGTELLTLYK